MKTTKYKTQYSFADSLNAPQSRFYKNIMMPATHQQHIPKKINVLVGNTGNFYYAKANGGNNNQNNAHFNQQTQQLSAGIMGLTNPNRSSRQRFAPYPFYKRSYAHTVMQPTPQRCYNFQLQSQQQVMASNNLVNIANQSSASVSPSDSDYGWVSINVELFICFSYFRTLHFEENIFFFTIFQTYFLNIHAHIIRFA